MNMFHYLRPCESCQIMLRTLRRQIKATYIEQTEVAAK